MHDDHLQRVVNGGLRRVDDEVSQREAEALRGSPQAERLGARPGERLLLRRSAQRGQRRRLALISTFLLLGLEAQRHTDRQVGETSALCF